METLILEKTKDTPKVILDANNNIFLIEKKSLPEDAMSFYKPIIDWVELYCQSPNSETIFEFKLEYFNTSTTKQFAKLFLTLEKLVPDNNVIIKWYYDKNDLDMKLSGERFNKLLKLDFELIELD